MIQQQFAEHAAEVLEREEVVIGLAVAGSWLTNEIDEFSDLDLILLTREKISDNKERMLQYARRFGTLLAAFTGEHVGEPRLLICLYDTPLLHVDIKFLTPEEFNKRIENPVFLLDKTGELQKIIQQTEAKFPHPDFQWIEDRFWIWVHYALLKIGRGEYFEALDFFGFLRMSVFGPLLHIKNGNLPRGVRRVETQLHHQDFEKLKSTIAEYNSDSLLRALENSVELYRHLRDELFDKNVHLRHTTETRVMNFLKEIREKFSQP